MDRHGNLVVNSDFLKNPIDRQKLNSNINKTAQENGVFVEYNPFVGTNTKKDLTGIVSQSSSVSSIKTCEKHHVQERPRRFDKSKVATKSNVPSASGTKTGKEPIVEIITHSDATTDSEIIVSSETTENSTRVKLKIEPGHGIKCIRINFGTNERNDD